LVAAGRPHYRPIITQTAAVDDSFSLSLSQSLSQSKIDCDSDCD